jgi:hypothetical protein
MAHLQCAKRYGFALRRRADLTDTGKRETHRAYDNHRK